LRCPIQIQIKINGSRVVAQQTLNATSTSVILNNLTTGVAYVARLVAFTRVGLGPYSAPFQLLMDPTLLPQKPARYTKEHNPCSATTNLYHSGSYVHLGHKFIFFLSIHLAW
jgi:hypothetical protein